MYVVDTILTEHERGYPLQIVYIRPNTSVSFQEPQGSIYTRTVILYYKIIIYLMLLCLLKYCFCWSCKVYWQHLSPKATSIFYPIGAQLGILGCHSLIVHCFVSCSVKKHLPFNGYVKLLDTLYQWTVH